MSKPTLNYPLLKYQELMGYAFAMTMLCLLITWGIELLAKELFRLG